MKPELAAHKMHPFVDAANLPQNHPDFGKNHLREMLNQITTFQVTGEKAHRWLGFVQGCIVMGGGATVDQLKHVNFKAN